ncbi:MAG TPA: site-2 protease family protein [Methylomirabilota bacterium]|nr:site-2 protease family protein [Methylomirabilota bacterium]
MIELFRVRGIPIRIDLGWLLVFGLVTWSLASGYFPAVLPADGPLAYALYGVLAALLLFVSVLLHELAHALAALDQGVPVGGITLHVFGGVSQLDAEPPTPRAELLIAVVGPLTSFALAGLCLVIDRAVAGPAAFHAVAGYLVVVNLVVGVFNLVPGFPLDGGRVLRAVVWWWTGRLSRATQIASRCGSAVGFVLVGVGVARAVAGDLVGGLWFVLIGLFLHQAARASWEIVRLRERLEALRVEDVMTRAPLIADAVAPLAEAGTTLRAEHVVRPRDSAWQAFVTLGRTRGGRVAVVDGPALVGVVTRRDLQDALAADTDRARVARPAA